jgi:CheY-like chemotaxis protein
MLNSLSTTASPIRVLYVDDDPDDRMFFAEALGKLKINYKLNTISHCLELIKYLDEGEKFDIIFLDVNMPLMNGKQCLRVLKSNENYRDIPVIIFTVSQNQHDIDEVYEIGAHFYVVKPYAHANFVASLEKIFELDWRKPQAVPDKEKFVINYSFSDSI